MIQSTIWHNKNGKSFQLLLDILPEREIPEPGKYYLYETKEKIEGVVSAHIGRYFGEFKNSREAYYISEIIQKTDVKELYDSIRKLYKGLKGYNDRYSKQLQKTLLKYFRDLDFAEFKDEVEDLIPECRLSSMWNAQIRILFLEMVMRTN